MLRTRLRWVRPDSRCCEHACDWSAGAGPGGVGAGARDVRTWQPGGRGEQPSGRLACLHVSWLQERRPRP
eukprot:711947-Prorocentrum_minimum.AAC.1